MSSIFDLLVMLTGPVTAPPPPTGNFVLDEAGDPILDEAGQPILQEGG